MKCEHKRYKKNYPFGRKSSSRKICKDCGEVVTDKFLADRRMGKRR
jgi:hypothetical protein